MKLITPITEEDIKKLKIYDEISISGAIFTGRDAALPKLVELFEVGRLGELGLDLQGGVIFHTAVSSAGIGPTSSNKLDIESSIPMLSKAGIKIHLGKGSLDDTTAAALQENNAIFAITPPVTALLTAKVREKRVAAFPELGMEALHLLEVVEFPAVVAIAHGKSIFTE